MRLYDQYRAWVRVHSNSIAAFEGALSSLTWLLPDRFSDSELFLEALHSLLGFSSLFHDRILSTEENAPPAQQLPWPFWIAALQQVEVLVEMGSNKLERQGQCNKYTPLVFLEAIKASLRLLTLRQSDARMLIDGGLTASLPSQRSPETKLQAVCKALACFHQRNCSGGNNEAVSQQEREVKGADSKVPSEAFNSIQGVPNEGTQAPSTSGRGRYWWERPPAGSTASAAVGRSRLAEERLAQQKLLQAHAQWKGPSGQNLLTAAEVAFILRSLLYVLALQRWGRRSWKPWCLSLGLEVASAQLSMLAAAVAQTPSQQKQMPPIADSLGILQVLQTFRWSQTEQRELTRRRLLFAYYLMKSPCFDAFTGKGIRLGQRALRPVPIAGSLADKAAEIIHGIQQYYTYTNAS